MVQISNGGYSVRIVKNYTRELIVSVLMLFILVGMLLYKTYEQRVVVEQTAAMTIQLEKCVTNLEKVHLINEQGTIYHATLETSSTTAVQDDHMSRTPVLSE